MALTGRRLVRQRRVLASLLQALREGYFALRAHGGAGLLDEVYREFNVLAAYLGSERRQGVETDALLSQLLAALDFAVLIVDERDRVVDLNLFAEELLVVPFFTTKPNDSGIGLVLARQIIEAHGGSLRLMSTRGARGTTVTVRLRADPGRQDADGNSS
jgi:nitrogen fixation/metabolism regulation signal transduction histidine kinase